MTSKIILICFMFIQVSFILTRGQNLRDLSYSNNDREVADFFGPNVKPAAPTTTSTTPAPTTTKKGGFFSGLRNIFRSEKKTEAPPVTPVTPSTPVTKPQVIHSSRPVTPSVTPSTVNPRISIPQQPPPVPQRPAPSITPNPATAPKPNQPAQVPPRSSVGQDFPALPSRSGTPTLPVSQNNIPQPPPRRQEDFPAQPSRPGTPTEPQTPTGSTVWSTPNPSSPPPSVQFVPHQPAPASRPSQPPTPPTRSTPNQQPSTGNRLTPTQPSNANRNQNKNANTSQSLATDAEITALTEALLSKDINNPSKYVTVNLQGKTSSQSLTDEAPNRLLTINETAVYNIRSISKLRDLYNNYEIDTSVNEYVTSMERREESDFLDVIMTSSVMRHAMSFLQQKNIVSPDPETHRNLVKRLWFNMYSRGGGKIGSSAFEHIFLAEIKNSTVMGLHNWLYFYEKEKSGDIDYKGYIKNLNIGNKGSVLKLRFSYNKLNKPVNSMFIGTSPELEIAIYTICFELRPDSNCPISLDGKTFQMNTHTFRYRGQNLIGSAYAEI